MKRILVIALALCMLFACAACGSTASNVSGGSAESAESAAAPSSENKTEYPKDTVHIVVTFGAGGGNDLIARAVASGLESVTGGTFVVDNITGGGGMTGTYEAMSSKPDGYTILCQDASLNASFVTQAGAIPLTLDNMVPVASVYSCPAWALSASENGYETLQDFVDDARANPGKLTIGTAVTTGGQYLMACAIVHYFDLDVTIVPFEGGNELKSAVLGNHVDMGIIFSPILLSEVKEGLVKVLVAGAPLTGISEESLRDVKTLADYGMEHSFSSTRGFFVPVGTPQEVVDVLQQLFKEALETQAVADFAESFGYDPSYQNAAEYKEFLDQEYLSFKAAFEASQS